MAPRCGRNWTRTQLTTALTVASLLAAACTGQTEQAKASDEATGDITSTTESILPSTTVLRGTVSPVDLQAETDSAPEIQATAPDLAAFAEGVGANTVVAQVDSILHIYQDGKQSSQLLGPMVWAWSDGTFIYQTSAEGGYTFFSSASLLNGTVVCETELPIHHATERVDETYVMAVTEQEAVTFDTWDGRSPYAIPTFAVDCQTDDSQAIASFTTYGVGETGYGFVDRVAGREFTGLGDAEGNADMVNEQGVSLNGEDHAGYHTFSHDGSQVAYGDFTDSPSPHHTKVVKLRDTTSGILLWQSELDTAFARLHFTDDSLLVQLFDPANDGSTPSDSVVVLDLSTGTEVASASIDFDLLYVGP